MPAVSVMVSSALSVPAAEGVNFTLIAQEPPPAVREWLAQLSVSVKSEAFAPEIATAETPVCSEPRLLSITVEACSEHPQQYSGERQRVGKSNHACP